MGMMDRQEEDDIQKVLSSGKRREEKHIIETVSQDQYLIQSK